MSDGPKEKETLPLILIELTGLKVTVPVAVLLAPLLSQVVATWLMFGAVLLSFFGWGLFLKARANLRNGPENTNRKAFLDANVDLASQVIPRAIIAWLLIAVWLGMARCLWTFEAFFPALIALQCFSPTFLLYQEVFLAKKEYERQN